MKKEEKNIRIHIDASHEVSVFVFVCLATAKMIYLTEALRPGRYLTFLNFPQPLFCCDENNWGPEQLVLEDSLTMPSPSGNRTKIKRVGKHPRVFWTGTFPVHHRDYLTRLCTMGKKHVFTEDSRVFSPLSFPPTFFHPSSICWVSTWAGGWGRARRSARHSCVPRSQRVALFLFLIQRLWVGLCPTCPPASEVKVRARHGWLHRFVAASFRLHSGRRIDLYFRRRCIFFLHPWETEMKLQTANEKLFEQPIATNSGESFPAEPFQLGGGGL